ncbi:MAG TPA: 1,4-dihydroxy-6-naphthoate synthase [Methanosarcinales archaeon]|nr:1,4-dihydroxy-6-naphthoate synthase [Methanosarcinales archaeon]
MKKLYLGYSPCPNDTFIFYALTHQKIDTENIIFKEVLEDVETLNFMALEGILDITKVSYHAFGYLRDKYCLLRSGSALGYGCGPLVIAKEPFNIEELENKKIAIPGKLTTAHLLLQLMTQKIKNVVVMQFDKIIDAVFKEKVDAGLIIHESRFTYQNYGLKKIIDLGDWWEKETGLPIPLGGIIIKRSLGSDIIKKVDNAIHRSIEYAYANPEETKDYIKAHAQELDSDVIQQHICLYVNDYSLDLGEDGIFAVQYLFEQAQEKGILPKSDLPLFI